MARTLRTRTDNGMHFARTVISAEVALIRRDDLRGVWEVEGEMFATRDAAYEAAEAALDRMEADDDA